VGTLSLRRLAARPNARRRSQLLGLPGDVASVLLTYKYYARVPRLPMPDLRCFFFEPPSWVTIGPSFSGQSFLCRQVSDKMTLSF
jgi:hypothetical protein